MNADLLPKNEKIYPLKVLTTGSNPKDNFINWKEDRINQILELAENAAKFSGEEVEYIDLRDSNNVFIKIKSVLIDLGELDESAYSRLKVIASILPNLNKIDKKIKYVDLRWEVAKYVTVEGKKHEDNIDTVQSENG